MMPAGFHFDKMMTEGEGMQMRADGGGRQRAGYSFTVLALCLGGTGDLQQAADC